MTKSRFFIAVLLVLAAGAAFAADATQLSVTVKETQILDKPSALGKVLGLLAYGEKVTVLDQPAGASKAWLRVKSSDGKLQGWVRSSALTKKEISMSAGTQTASQSASSADVAAAGKGFNKEVEAQYSKDQKLDYTWVDKMEAFKVPPEQVAAFMTSGGLREPGGEE
jgi:uncharacterized protein YgiM (DUF1202 family)